MKNSLIYSFLILSLACLWGCADDNYPGAQISPYFSMYDLRNLYKGQDVTLTKEKMFGSDKLTGVVVSDHSGGNMPAGMLCIQDFRRIGLRGISIAIGNAAANYVPGDSVIVKVEGAVLKKENGILQVTGVSADNIVKVASNVPIGVNRVPVNKLMQNPDNYESTLVAIVKGGFDPLPQAGDKLGGDKTLNDGFGNINLHTETTSPVADVDAPVLANYYGIPFNKQVREDSVAPQFHLRTAADVVVLSSELTVAPVIITGMVTDVKGGDGNYEYFQFMATRDIDFSVTPFAVVATNNANASTPTGPPIAGWATGSMRTFKFNLTTGRAAKGTYFYVGGAGRCINGSGSTNISSSNWIRYFNYVNQDGDGFGNKTTGLMANSGNASGVAIFEGTNITVDSRPVDVMFVHNGGSLWGEGPPQRGYKITNTDYYDIINPLTLQSQPYFVTGSNTLCLAYATADVGYWYMLGGEYNVTLGRWMKARQQNLFQMTKQTTIEELEGEAATKLLE
ncbi:DUF5689 domain-containing protein [Chitinophaga barathri]|uniref:DUF5689 domain-containing protein n=1 Tax=Chitinophaga barathri TaxID=1647451 RepID=A0A3N4MP51_9BACT|nr:DUF5689 domain-containing protein [Chitinophaga barathri]RPD41449.1 hypothetical protein EG028_09015 [Chitinophaga barathri]